MFLFSFILAFHIQTFKDSSHDSIVSQSQHLLQQTTAFLQQSHQHQQSLHGAHQPQHHLTTSPSNPNQNFNSVSGANRSTLLLHDQQLHQRQLTNNITTQMGSGPSAGPAQVQLMSPSMGADQQLLHQQAHSSIQSVKQVRSDKQSSSGSGAANSIQLPPPHLHQAGVAMIKSSPPPPPPPPQVPNPSSQQSQQSALMKNHSSPLPAVYQSRQVQHQQAPHYHHHQIHQQSQGSRSIQSEYQSNQKMQPVNMIPPPPPSPPSMHHQYQHQMMPRDHQSRMAGVAITSNRLTSCPVQYCTFQCDRTV